MPTPQYPSALPGPSTYVLGPSVQALASDNEDGPVALRRRSRQPGGTAKVTFRYLEGDYATFVSWWKNDLKYGHRWFTISVPSAGGITWHVVRFAERYSAVLQGHRLWSVSAVLEIRDRQFVPVIPGDPYGEFVLSLLRGDGNDGSTTFVDQIPGRSWFRNGGPTISAEQSMFGGSSYKSAGGGYLSAVSPGQEWLLSGDYSIECWLLCNAISSGGAVLQINTSTGQGTLVSINSSTTISHTVGGAATRSQGDGLGSIYGRWVHVFAGRQGTTTYTALNGVMRVDAGEFSNANGTITNVWFGLQVFGSPTYLYIDDFRVTKGICRQTASFTPPLTAHLNP